jgi:hypothetical protein
MVSESRGAHKTKIDYRVHKQGPKKPQKLDGVFARLLTGLDFLSASISRTLSLAALKTAPVMARSQFLCAPTPNSVRQYSGASFLRP